VNSVYLCAGARNTFYLLTCLLTKLIVGCCIFEVPYTAAVAVADRGGLERVTRS